MITKLERRLADGFSFLSSYTWSKALDSGSLIDSQPRDVYNRSLSKGRAQFDIRHRAVLSGTFEPPLGRGKAYVSSGPLAYVVGGWQLNGIASLNSGFPFSVNANGDVCNCGAANQTAQQVGDPWAGDVRRREQWFNTAAFANPARGTFGSSGRHILDGPGSATVDLSVFRTFPIREGAGVQFRAEFFNLFNRVNFNNPGSTVGTNSYGLIQGAAAARVTQFALKVRF
jgi:hypothetical protein